MPSDKIELRKQAFKSRGLTGDESRRRREEATVEIRKVKREDSLNKKRLAFPSNDAAAGNDSTQPLSDDEFSHSEYFDKDADLRNRLNVILNQMNSTVLEDQVEGTIAIRKILSSEKNPPINLVIQCGAIPRLVQFLKGAPYVSNATTPEAIQKAVETLLLEASWALTNVASGNSQQTWTVVQHDSIPVLVNLLNHPSLEIQEQVVWALGNIAGDSPNCRDLVLNANVLPSLLQVIHNGATSSPIRLSLVRNASWALSNVCRGKPLPDWTKVSTALPVLAGLLSSNDKEILIDACWCLSYLSDGPNDHIEEVIRSGVVPRLVQLLSHESHTIQTPALRALGNIVTGSDTQTQHVIEAGGLQAFHRLLASPKMTIVKEVCWAISNVTAGTLQQIQCVIDAQIVPALIHLMEVGDYKIRKEACWALSNATSGKRYAVDQIRYLVDQGIIKPFCEILTVLDNKTIMVALDAIDAILEVGETIRYSSADMVNPYSILVEEHGGMDTIYELQSHNNEDIYNKSKFILDKYFSADDMDLNASTTATASDSFQFSAPEMPKGGFTFQ